MPYCFDCPQCREKNYGLRTAPTYGPGTAYTYFDDLTCTRCGVGGLYWVTNDAAAQALGRGTNRVPSNRIAVGVSQSTIGWFDPDGRKAIQTEVVDLMRAVASLSSSFNQGERQKALLPRRVDVAEGLCEGMSLHWIRRVLQGGKTEFTVSKTKGTVDRTDAVRLEKLRRQLTVGANVQTTSDTQLTDQHLTSLGFRKLSNGSWSIPNNLSTLWDETQAKGKYAKIWEGLSGRFDGHLNTGGRQSSRPFSNIVAVSSTNRTAQNLETFVANMCRDPNFGPGTAVLIAVGLRVGIGESGGSISGHAIAAYCRSPSEQFLFDPNIGVWVCTTRGALREAIALLIGTGWTTRMNWRLEETFGYSLFQARPSETNVQRGERPLQMTTSPESTAVVNHGLIPSVLPSSGPPRTNPSPSPSIPSTPSVTPLPTPTPRPSPSSGGGGFHPQGPQRTTTPTPTVPSGSSPNQQLKTLLEQARDDPARQNPGAWGSHGLTQGGWVKVPFTLVQKIRAANLTTSDLVMVGPNGAFAIAKEHINQLIAMIR